MNEKSIDLDVFMKVSKQLEADFDQTNHSEKASVPFLIRGPTSLNKCQLILGEGISDE